MFLKVIGSSISNSFQTTAAPPPGVSTFKYSVKIMNPQRKSEFEVLMMKTKDRFGSITNLKKQVQSEFKDKLGTLKQIGYIEPGHGLRGKQRWLSSDDDLCTMYETHSGNTEILLWCFEERGTKRSLEEKSPSESGPAQKIPKTNYAQHVDNIHEIESDLKKKHKEAFTDAQYRAWANFD